MALVEMKRLRAVALQSRRRSLLRQLRREGCVEVEAAQESTDFGQENALERTTEENTGAGEYLTVIGQAMEVLSKYVPPPSRPLLAGKPQLTESQLYDEKVLDKALAAARQINKAAEEMNRLLGEIGRLEGTVTQLKPWKSLDVPLEYHMDGAVEYLRGVLPGATDLKELEGELAEKAPACQMEQVSSDNEQHYVTFLIHQSCKEQAMAIIKQRGFAQAPQEGEGTPAQYIGALEKQMAQMEQQRQDLIGKIKECGDAYRAMEQALDACSMARKTPWSSPAGCRKRPRSGWKRCWNGKAAPIAWRIPGKGKIPPRPWRMDPWPSLLTPSPRCMACLVTAA